MIFLNALLLFGAAAFSIPLIIHLLNRSKFQTVDWGAMIFLEDAAKVNSRRLQWQTWLLLLLRCLIPIVLAICMARPMLKSFFFPSGFGTSVGDQTASVFVIDNSISMQAITGASDEKSPSTLTKQSIHVAEQIVARSGNNTRWSISTGEDNGTDVRMGFSRDRNVVKEWMGKVDSRSGSFSLLDEISSALDTLAKSPEPAQRVIVLSDFQTSDIQALDPTSLATLRDKIQRLPIKPVIALMPIGNRTSGLQPAVAPENLSIAIDLNTQSLVGVKQPWELRARIKNHSPVAVSNVPILIQVDGTSLTTRRVDLPGDAESQLAVTLEFPNHGSHVVTASIEHAEAVSDDNQASWAVLAVGAIPTLLVSDDFSDQQKRSRSDNNKEASWSDSDYLTAALGYSPRKRNTSNKKDGLFSITRLASDQCTLAELKRHRLLLLANVSQLSRECSDYLSTWVGQGGTLIAFPGEETNIKWYNSLLEPAATLPSVSPKAIGDAVQARQRLFPYAYHPYAYQPKPETPEENQPSTSIQREFHSHPSVRFLNDPRWGAIDSLDVRKWLRMSPHDPSTAIKLRTSGIRFVAVDTEPMALATGVDSKTKEVSIAKNGSENITESSNNKIKDLTTQKPSVESINTVLSLTSGDPFLAIKQVGLGSVIQCATSAGDQWSNWPMRPVYLPMIQQLLSGSIPPSRWICNVKTGETLTLPTEDMLRWIESNWSRDDLTSASKDSQNIDSATRVMRWTLPTANPKESTDENLTDQNITDQLTNRDRAEGETGQPAIVARQPGVYTATPQATSSDEQARTTRRSKQPSTPVSMCAQLKPGESDLRLESMDGLVSIAEQIDAKVILSLEDYVSLESGESSELWRWFLIALLGLLFAEVLLQRYLSIGGTR